MNCLEWVIIIFALGFVSMIEVCAITTCISRLLDQKMKVKAKIEWVLFEKEMKLFAEAITKCLDAFLSRLDEDVKQPAPNFTNYRDYNEVGYSTKPVVEVKELKKTTRKKKNTSDFDDLKEIDDELNL